MTSPDMASAEVGHTPLPWEYTATVAMHDRPDLPCIVDGFRLVVAQLWDDGHSEEECEANAAFIVRACNAHYELLGALDECVELLTRLGANEGPYTILAAGKAAIAKARGEQA